MLQKDLTNLLSQIRHDAKICVSRDKIDLTDFREKYDIPFGMTESRVISIDSVELPIAFKHFFGVYVTHDEIMKELPEVCKQLGMNLEPTTDANSSQRIVSGYCIEMY